jgi:hypothetical protein
MYRKRSPVVKDKGGVDNEKKTVFPIFTDESKFRVKK